MCRIPAPTGFRRTHFSPTVLRRIPSPTILCWPQSIPTVMHRVPTPPDFRRPHFNIVLDSSACSSSDKFASDSFLSISDIKLSDSNFSENRTISVGINKVLHINENIITFFLQNNTIRIVISKGFNNKYNFFAY